MYLLDSIFELDLEEKPGIYNFYYRPKIADYDLYHDDDILGGEKIIQLINERFVEPMCNNNQEMNIKLDFEQGLNGTLSREFKGISQKSFNTKIIENSFNAKEEFCNLNMRSSFQSLMSSISNDFLSPIYIGVSHNIKDRIEEHYNNFYSAKSMISKNADVNETDFGTRAAKFADAREISFSVKYIEMNDLNKEDSYKMALMMEWVLNQQNTPVLGRK